MKTQLLLSDDDSDLVTQLQLGFAGCHTLSAVTLKPDELPTLPGVDALYLTLIAAERWDPKLVFYEAQILKTRPEDEGWPPYIVAGIAMKQDDPRAGNPGAELKLVMTAVLAAVEAYNHQNNFPIRRVAFWADHLRISRMDPTAAGEIIRSTYEEHYSEQDMRYV